MRTVKAQYFLSYAVAGSLTPYLSVYFRERGMGNDQVGYAMAASSVAVLLSPALVTLLADTRLDARRLMAGLFVLASAAVLAMGLGGGLAWGGFVWIALLWFIHSLAYQPMLPLQDGINFSLQRRRALANLPAVPYHRIRIWGTIGFIVPVLLLFVAMRAGAPIGAALLSAALFALLGAANTLLLPDPRIRALPDPTSPLPGVAQLPTLQAARAMLNPPVFIFMLAMFLVHMSVCAYYAFYPIYLRETLFLSNAWLGPVMHLGVVVEVFFMLGFGYLARRRGIKGVMIGGCLAIALRLGLLAMSPGLTVAVATQFFHGMQALVLQILPAVLLDRYAEDRYRHSIQGLYFMLALGGGRIVGNLLSGRIAHHSLPAAFACGTALALLAGTLVAVGFWEKKPATATPA